MSRFKTDQTEMHYDTRGAAYGPIVLWAHGWGQNSRAYDLLCAGPIEPLGRHILVDFPGFGESGAPPLTWGTAEYADFMAEFLKSQTGGQPVIWIGHSFGCRVGLQIAARHPDLVKGMFLIAAAGLKRKRPLPQQLYFKARIYLYKFLKKMVSFGLSEEWLKSKFGSRDYKSAGAIRPLFTRVVNEDLTPVAAQAACPVMLVYGENDTETPPEIGERLQKLIKNAELVLLSEQDHYSVLSGGRHQVARHLKNFIEKMDKAS